MTSVPAQTDGLRQHPATLPGDASQWAQSDIELLGRLGRYRLDLDSGVMSFTGGLTQLLGTPPGTAWNWSGLLSRLHPEDRSRVELALLDELAHEASLHCRFNRADGAMLHLSITQHTVDARTRIGVVQDIGPLLSVNEGVWRNEQRYQALVDSQSDLILRVDAQGRVTFVNRAAGDLLGRPITEIIGQPWQELIHPDDLRVNLKAFSGLWGNPGGRVTVESRVLAADDVRWFAWDGFGIHDSAGRVVEIQAVGRDITQRREMEEALKHSAVLFRSLIENTPAPLSLDAWDDGRFLQINPAFERVLGYSAAELMEVGWRQITDPADIAANDRMRERLLSGQARTESMVKRFYTRDGDTVWGNLQLSLLRHPDGSPYAFIAQFMDISDRMRAEAALRQAAERSEEASRVKSEFLANMSHELRTPLNAIIGFSEMLEGRFFGPLTDKQHEYIADIKRSGTHLLSIINDVLDMSKIEAGHFDLTEEEVDPAAIVEQGLRLVGAQADSKGVRLHRLAPADLPHLRADPRAFKQILINLLSNAVKFTPAGGEVSVIIDDGPAGYCVIVEDTGIGIPENMIDIVLTPFGQVEGSMTRQHEGTGLGLSISRSLMDLHGGTLTLVSEPGSGTTVTMCFPRWRRVVSPDRPLPPKRSPPG